MGKDLSVVVDGRPGELARLGEATGGTGGNIAGVRCVATGGGTAIVHILVEDVPATCSARASAGLEIRDGRELIVVDVEGRPGTMAQVVRKIADAAVNINLAYTSFGGARPWGRPLRKGARGGLRQASRVWHACLLARLGGAR